MNRSKATPFDGLLGLAAPQLPVSASVTVVIQGQAVRSVRDARAAVTAGLQPDDEPDDLLALEARRAAAALKAAVRRANDAKYRSKADAAARRRAWAQANPEKMAAYREKHRAKKLKDPHYKARQAAAARAYYERNRERLQAEARERMRARYAKARASRERQGSQP